MHGRYYCLGYNVWPHISTYTHTRDHTHLLISASEQDSKAVRKKSNTELLYLNHLGNLTHTHTQTQTHL